MDNEAEAKVESAYTQFKKDVAERVPGKVLFTCVWGSHAHNCATADSDVDFLAVYQWSAADTWKLSTPAETVDHKGPDWQAHEISKFCRLLMKGNPSAVECVFPRRWTEYDNAWYELMGLGDYFINQTTMKQYLGYARAQFERYRNHMSLHSKGGGVTTKWLYHMARMLYDAERIVLGQAPTIWKEGTEQEYLMKIRAGEVPIEEIEQLYLKTNADIDALKPWAIREKADEEIVNHWLYQLRLREVSARRSTYANAV